MLGVILAAMAGVPGLLSGAGFMRHLWLGGLSSGMIFDLGVFLAVWGSFTGYIFALLDKSPGPGASPDKGVCMS